MEPRITLAAGQLGRMRGMNAAYHRQFFSDIRFTTSVVLALFVAGAAIDPLIHLGIPFVALLGATQTAFAASYLLFSRHYSTHLEQYLARHAQADSLIAHKLEDEYLFRLGTPKIVVAGRPWTWFGYMTLFYTALGITTYVAGLAAGWEALWSALPLPVAVSYLATLSLLTISALIVGVAWFVRGEGETRLTSVLAENTRD